MFKPPKKEVNNSQRHKLAPSNNFNYLIVKPKEKKTEVDYLLELVAYTLSYMNEYLELKRFLSYDYFDSCFSGYYDFYLWTELLLEQHNTKKREKIHKVLKQSLNYQSLTASRQFKVPVWASTSIWIQLDYHNGTDNEIK